MAAVQDLTKAEVSAMITDAALKAWWDAAPAYDASFGTTELMIKLEQAMYRAQVAKNTAANPAVGEALNAYSAPVTSTVSLNPATGDQTFTQTVSISAVTATNSDITIPSLI